MKKKKILWLGLSFLLVAALVLTSCAEAVPGQQEEEEKEVLPAVGEQEEEEEPTIEDPTVTAYNLSITVSPPGSGSVSPPGGKYESGLQVTLTATPAGGYIFDYWDGATSGSSHTVTIIMSSNKSTTAHFKAVETQETPTPTPTIITSEAGLASFLSTNFSTLETSLGVAKFTFEVKYNDTINYPYDYKIMVDYDGSFVYDLIYSNKISTELANKVGDEMRAHQEKLARAIIAKMPNTKLIGSYYSWGYRYPSIKVDRYTITYCSWSNLGSATWQTKYADAKITDFVWTPDSLMWPGQKDYKLGR